MSNRLFELIKMEGSEFESAFKKASLKGAGTPQEVADFRENYFNKYVSKFFPFPHRITKSIIIDSYGNSSDSIDTVVLNPNHPYIVGNNDKFDVVLADGVDVAIELKPDVSNKKELIRGLEQSTSVKQLARRESPLVGHHPKELKELAKKIPTIIFSLKAKKNPKETADEMFEYYEINNIPAEDRVDFLVINGTGIISIYKHPATSILTSDDIGLFYEDWRELTLVAFIMKLHSVFHATPTLGHPILRHYLGDVKPYEVLQRHYP